MKNITSKIIIAVVVIIMLIPIVSSIIENNSIKTITKDELQSSIDKTDQYGFGLIYIGKNDKAYKKTILELVKKYNSKNTPTQSFYMDIDQISSMDLLTIVGNTAVTDAYIFVSNKEIMRVETSKLDDSKLEAYIIEYAVAYNEDGTIKPIDTSLVYYKTVKDFKEFKTLVTNKKNVSMFVFGRNTCFWCNLFKPVYNTVAEQANLDIYYFDSDSYDKDELDKIQKYGLEIPESCGGGKLDEGYSTPLTIFTKNNKVIDCISGYTGKQKLLTKLQTVGMIKTSSDSTDTKTKK